MKNTNPIHAINKISSLYDNLEYYANEHKDELKGEFIGERQITGIGKKCLKLDNDFVNWEDIDEQYLNYIEGIDVKGEMEEIISFFLSQREFINGLNKEFQEKFGTTITVQEETKKEHRELALVQAGTVMDCRVFKLNQRVDRETWKLISKHFKYYNYYDLVGSNTGEYCCDETGIETVRKILGITAETEYMTDNKEQDVKRI